MKAAADAPAASPGLTRKVSEMLTDSLEAIQSAILTASETPEKTPLEKTDSVRLDEDLQKLEKENAEMEKMLGVQQRPSFIASDSPFNSPTGSAVTEGQPVTQGEDGTWRLQSTEATILTGNPQNPLVAVFSKLLGGFCIPCKQAAAIAG